MLIAQQKRKQNIAEYILYLWQLEDLLRALQFSPEAIYSQLVAPTGADEEQKQTIFLWYMDIVGLLRKEGKEQSGHLDHTLHLIADMHNLNLQLLSLPVGERYRTLAAQLAPELPRLRTIIGKEEMSDTELCFRALYAAMLYRIRGKGGEHAIEDTIAVVSPVIARRADAFIRPKPSKTEITSTYNPLSWTTACISEREHTLSNRCSQNSCNRSPDTRITTSDRFAFSGEGHTLPMKIPE